jgi:hypothetical protein
MRHSYQSKSEQLDGHKPNEFHIEQDSVAQGLGLPPVSANQLQMPESQKSMWNRMH